MSDPKTRKNDSPNQRTVDRQIIEAHFRSLAFLIRRIDSGMLSEEAQAAHMTVIECLDTLGNQAVPCLFNALDLVEQIEEAKRKKNLQ